MSGWEPCGLTRDQLSALKAELNETIADQYALIAQLQAAPDDEEEDESEWDEMRSLLQDYLVACGLPAQPMGPIPHRELDRLWDYVSGWSDRMSK